MVKKEKGDTGDERKKPKDQFSRRNKTSEVHQKVHQAKMRRASDKLFSAETRQAAAEARTPRQQLARLDKRGFKAAKERAKLEEHIYAGNGDVPLGKLRKS